MRMRYHARIFRRGAQLRVRREDAAQHVLDNKIRIVNDAIHTVPLHLEYCYWAV
jgi:hypothetical protein